MLVAVLSGCATPVTEKSLRVDVEVLDTQRRYERAYILQPGDRLEVYVHRHAALSRNVNVRPDGFISLPLLDDIKVWGKTPSELDKEITELLSKRIKDPEVTVIVENSPEPMVYLIGELPGPKALPYRQTKTVAQALASAGGVTKGAALTSISVIRLNDEGFLEAHTVTADQFNQAEIYMALNNMALHPNDMVLVPESGRAQFMRILQDINTALSPYYLIRALALLEDQ